MNKDIHRMILESMLAILYNCYVIVLQYIFFKRTLMRGTRQLASSLSPPHLWSRVLTVKMKRAQGDTTVPLPTPGGDRSRPAPSFTSTTLPNL